MKLVMWKKDLFFVVVAAAIIFVMAYAVYRLAPPGSRAITRLKRSPSSISFSFAWRGRDSGDLASRTNTAVLPLVRCAHGHVGYYSRLGASGSRDRRFHIADRGVADSPRTGKGRAARS
jgi:hypothetical protein